MVYWGFDKNKSYEDPHFYDRLPDQSIISRYGLPFLLSGTFVFICSLTNALRRRPYFSGIQKHIAGGLGGVALGELLERYFIRRAALHDAILQHYMQLHPEDFAEPPKKYYKDILLPWIPRR